MINILCFFSSDMENEEVQVSSDLTITEVWISVWESSMLQTDQIPGKNERQFLY